MSLQSRTLWPLLLWTGLTLAACRPPAPRGAAELASAPPATEASAAAQASAPSSATAASPTAPTAPTATDAAPPAQPSVPPTRIAFGSCNDLAQPQLLWEQITALHPDLWVWLGDIVYADTRDMKRLRKLYDAMRAEPGYAALRASTRVVGTWDDHDYGDNNAGKEYPKRAQSQVQLLDFLDEPKDSPRRKQKGVYAAYDVGEGEQQVRVIVLDTRYHRDPPGPDADVLGAAQWTWLQDQLTHSSAAVHVIVSSFQLVADSHPHEKWANFPAARQRMLALIGMSDARNVVVISGDRHYAELSVTEALPFGTRLYDLTSSSLSRPWDHDPAEPNAQRVGDYYWRVNFGLIEIDWAAQQMRLQIRDAEGQTQIDHALPLLP